MNVEHNVDSGDFEKLQQLLKEYTAKLRQVCDAKAKDNYRKDFIFNAGMFLGVIVFIGLGSSVIFRLEIPLATKINYLLPFSIIGMLLWTSSYFLFISLKNIGFLLPIKTPTYRESRFSAETLAISLEKIIKLASQYSEHAMSRMSDKFEIDLRLAEAEATLLMYHDLFKYFRKKSRT